VRCAFEFSACQEQAGVLRLQAPRKKGLRTLDKRAFCIERNGILAHDCSMKTSRRKLEEFLWIAGLHAPARHLFSTTLGREAAQARQKMKGFYGRILKPGVLAFDIGANAGVMSETFASAGAKVIALEPNSDCVRHIQLSYHDLEIQVIQAAAGPRNGVAALNVSDAWDLTSSMSPDWIEAIQRRDARYRGNWSRQYVVPMVTVDALIEYFGMPYFIKIDVEGFEEQVLHGLSTQPHLLSFEFHNAFLSATLRCLDLAVFAEGSSFNMVTNSAWGYPACFDSERWFGKEELRQRLLNLPDGEYQGDIFVRVPGTPLAE
jgi:FkbM family methyltransferase